MDKMCLIPCPKLPCVVKWLVYFNPKRLTFKWLIKQLVTAASGSVFKHGHVKTWPRSLYVWAHRNVKPYKKLVSENKCKI